MSALNISFRNFGCSGLLFASILEINTVGMSPKYIAEYAWAIFVLVFDEPTKTVLL